MGNGATFKKVRVVCGILQGTAFNSSPFIYALSYSVSSLYIYQNDTKVSQRIQNPSDVPHLQHALDSIYRCTEDNHEHFDVGKAPSTAL